MNVILERAIHKQLLSTIWYRIRKPATLSEKEVFRRQEKLLNSVLNYACKYVPYYKEWSEGKGTLRLTNFPIVSKQDIMSQFESFQSIIKERFVITDSYTGGSTGEPFHILNAGNYEYEFGKRKWETMGYVRGDRILAMDGTKIPTEECSKGVYWKPKNKDDIPFGSWALSSLYLSDDNAEEYCSFIRDLSPDFIRGYPSFVYAVACYAEKLKIDIKGHIKGIELTSESAMPYQIEKIKEVYGAPVFLQYGHTEQCVFAYSYDDTYKYRVEPLYGYVEVLNENGQHVKEGEVGEVVVTTLHNYAMPLIRYRTGDNAEYGGRDSRYIYLNRVLGRTQDYIIGSNGDKVLLTALIFGQHCKAMGKIKKWQLEQYEQGKVVVHIVKQDDFTQADEQEIYEQFLNLGRVESVFDYVDSIQLTPRGKSKMLIQHLSM